MIFSSIPYNYNQHIVYIIFFINYDTFASFFTFSFNQKHFVLYLFLGNTAAIDKREVGFFLHQFIRIIYFCFFFLRSTFVYIFYAILLSCTWTTARTKRKIFFFNSLNYSLVIFFSCCILSDLTDTQWSS